MSTPGGLRCTPLSLLRAVKGKSYKRNERMVLISTRKLTVRRQAHIHNANHSNETSSAPKLVIMRSSRPRHMLQRNSLHIEALSLHALEATMRKRTRLQSRIAAEEALLAF